MFKRLFTRRSNKATTKVATTEFDPVVARVEVYSVAIKWPIAIVDYKQSEKHLMGGFIMQNRAKGNIVKVTNF